MREFQTELESYAARAIEAEIARLNNLLAAIKQPRREVAVAADTATPKRRGRPPMTAAARKAISRRMKARWAATKAAK